MKKLFLAILLTGALSCSRKSIYEEAVSDMREIEAEVTKTVEEIKKNENELVEADRGKILILQQKFIEKYAGKEIKGETEAQEACKYIIAYFPEHIDTFFKIYDRRIEIKNDKKTLLAPATNTKFAHEELSENIEGIKKQIEFCNIAVNEKK